MNDIDRMLQEVDASSSRGGQPVRRQRAMNLPQPPSWQAKQGELEAAYHAEYRLAMLGRQGIRAVDAIVEVNDHISSKGPLDPALEGELRRIEMLTGRIAEELLTRAGLY